METRYVSPEKFSKVSKGKKVVDYPNEWIKDVNGIRHHIINPDMEYKISVLEKKSYPWYLGMTYDEYAKATKEMFGDEDARVFVLECDWFPTELVAGIANGRYSNTSSLSRKTGWLRSFGVIDRPVLMVQAKVEDGWCTFYHDGKCELHEQGLKPTEGKLSHHSIRIDNFDPKKSLSWLVAKEWLPLQTELRKL